MGKAPHGPLIGEELARAKELLTHQQFRAYGYYRTNNAITWIATCLGVSPKAVRQLVVRAEQKLGYESRYAPKQKGAYKPAATKRSEVEQARLEEAARAFVAMAPIERRRFLQVVDPDADLRGLTAEQEIRALRWLLDEAASNEAAAARLEKRLAQIVRERHRWEREEELYDDAEPGEFEAMLEADFGTNPTTGKTFAPTDFVVDDGQGYDRV